MSGCRTCGFFKKVSISATCEYKYTWTLLKSITHIKTWCGQNIGTHWFLRESRRLLTGGKNANVRWERPTIRPPLGGWRPPEAARWQCVCLSVVGIEKTNKATIASHDTQMTGYERATLTLTSLKTSDVGERATEVWADKAEHKRRPLNRPYLIDQLGCSYSLCWRLLYAKPDTIWRQRHKCVSSHYRNETLNYWLWILRFYSWSNIRSIISFVTSITT